MPRSNSSRANGLAGATTAMRSSLFKARGFNMSGEAGHLVDDAQVGVAAEHLPQRRRATGRRRIRRCGDGGRQKSLLGAAVPDQRIFETLEGNPILLDGM